MKIIVDTYGMHISLQEGMLVFEKDQQVVREISLLHVSSIHVQKPARISSEAIIECINSQIPIYFETSQKIKAIIWSPAYGSIAHIRKKQALFSYSTLKYKVIKRLLIRKNTERIILLKNFTSTKVSKEWITNFENKIKWIEQTENQDNKIRAIEGQLSKIYFEIYNLLLPKNYPLNKRTYKNSSDIVNILLNYAYGILYNEITKALIYAGLDPDLSFFHVPQYNKHALSFDIIEPYRAWAEQWVLKTLRHPDIKNIDTLIESNQLLSNPVKRLLITIALEWLNTQKIKRNKRIKTPITHIQLDAYQLAQYILNLDEHELLKDICKNL